MAAKPPDPVFVLRGINDSVTSVDYIKPGTDSLTRHFMAGTQNGSVFLWDLKTKALINHWDAHKDTSVLWVKSTSPDKIWTQGRSDGVKLWDISEDSPKHVSSFSVPEYLGFCKCDIIELDDGHCLLALPGPEQEVVNIYDIKSETKICQLRHHNSQKEGTVMQVKWVQIGVKTLLLFCYESGSLVVWDWSNKNIFSSVNIGENPMCVEFNNKVLKGVCGTTSENLITFKMSSYGDLSTDTKIVITNPGIAACTNRFDNKILATGGWDYRIRLFSWNKFKPLAVLAYHRQTVQSLAYSENSVEQFPSGVILAAGSMDQSISFWSLLN